MRVFLSGGTRGNWQDRVISQCPGAEYYDPRTLRSADMTSIAVTERNWLDESDLVFVYLERDNPSGLGSAFEMGYATASSKPIIYVDEKQNSSSQWLAVHCVHAVDCFSDGIEMLRRAVNASEQPSSLGRRVQGGTSPQTIYTCMRGNDFSALDHRLDERTAAALAELMRDERALYEPLLLGTTSHPRQDYDWNVGYLIPHLHPEWIAQVLAKNGNVLYGSEGVAWGLGELDSRDSRVIDFLYKQCESQQDWRAWWCSAQALEKLDGIEYADLLKRTLSDPKWGNLDTCLAHVEDRPAVIGILRLVNQENLRSRVIPALVPLLSSSNHHVVQNAILLLERLRVDDSIVLDKLMDLYESAADAGHSIRPRVVEALGAIGDPGSRELLEESVGGAKYYRTRVYAAKGLAMIGDEASLPVLEDALDEETDSRVLPWITDAIYAIKDPERRRLNCLRREARWPENGMIMDHTNAWYANPNLYERFSAAEDPASIAFSRAKRYVPDGPARVVDVGSGTGRFAVYLALSRPELEIVALDAEPLMHAYLVDRIRDLGLGERAQAVLGSISQMPFEDESIDAVVSSWGFPSNMWNSDVCARQVGEVQRVLKPDGVLVTVGWDESFQDELSEMWYRYVPEPDYRRESLEDWRKRRVERVLTARNCGLTFVQRHLKVPVQFPSVDEAAFVMGHLFGYAAGEAVAKSGRRDFSMQVGVTVDTKESLTQSLTAIRRQTHPRSVAGV